MQNENTARGTNPLVSGSRTDILENCREHARFLERFGEELEPGYLHNVRMLSDALGVLQGLEAAPVGR